MNRKCFCFCLLMVVAMSVAAAIPDMKFRRLDSRDGLSSSQVNTIFRDSKGFVWIGTPYGLNRYDGYRFKVYYSHVKDSLTMLRNQVDDVQEAPDGRLWIRHTVEYSVLDPVTGHFDRHPDRWLHEQGIEGSVERVNIDRHGHYWVKTYDNGWWVLDTQRHCVRHFPFGSGDQQFDPKIGVSDMTEYGNSLLMVSNNGELVCLNTRSQRISWKSNRLQQRCELRNAGYVVRVDAQRNIWVLVEGRAYVYVRKAGRWYNSAAEALQTMGVQGFPMDMKIWDVAMDRHQQLWMATDHGGLCVVSLADKDMRQFKAVRNDETTISDNTLRRIYRDQQNRMWIATYMNGVNFYSDSPFRFQHLEAGNINTVCIDQHGDYWLGSNDRGIIRYNRQTGVQTLYNKENAGLASNIVVCSLAASDGTLWFGTYGGGLISWREGKFTTYQPKSSGLAHSSVWALCEDQLGNIWLGLLGGGVQRIDQATGRFDKLQNTTNGHLASNFISSIQLTESGRLLVGHTEFFSWIDPKTMKVENCRITQECNGIPPTSMTNQILQDSRGLLWQATMTGVTVSDTKGEKTWLIDRQAGLFDSMAGGLVEDARHTIWVISMHGLSNVIPQQQSDGNWTFTVRSYTNRDGLLSGPYNQRSAALAANGQVIVGGHEGIDIINPRDLRVAHVKEHPILSMVKMMDSPVEISEGTLEVEDDENQFSIHLATDNGEVHNRTRLVYRLLGFNDKWLYTDESQPHVTYVGLPSGNYTFETCILSDDGTLGEEICRLKIHILPPWYRSWWMNTLYLLLLAVGLFWFFRRNQEKLRLERMKLERENSNKMDELRQRFYDTVSDELRQPFRNLFESLNDIMRRETDEQRYEQQQQVFGHVEQLLEHMGKLVDDDAAKKKLQPQIREMEITSMDEKLVQDATNYVEENLSNADISVETMAEALAMSRVHLYKKLTAITDLTPSEFIRKVRLRHAEKLLRKSQLSVAEVAYKVGFNNPRYFSKYFKEMYGKMPSEYKNKAD
jgi:ligand-binding sensor domain-containing protein/AraC-like DNA-binding protein